MIALHACGDFQPDRLVGLERAAGMDGVHQGGGRACHDIGGRSGEFAAATRQRAEFVRTGRLTSVVQTLIREFESDQPVTS